MPKQIRFSDYYTPHATQALAHAAPEQFIVYGGAVGGGKSYYGCAEMIQLALDFPGAHVLVCRYESTTFERTTKQTLQKLLPEELIRTHHKAAPAYYELINDSIIFYGGIKTTDQKDPYSLVRSMELTGAFVDEATDLPEEMYLWLKSRLRWRDVKGGAKVPLWRMRLVLTCNPERGWIYDHIVRPQLEGKRPADTLFVMARTRDNTELDAAYIDMLKRSFPDEWQRRYMDGAWEFAEDDLSVIPFKLATEAAGREPQRHADVQLAVDVARFGGAETTIARREGNHVEIMEAFTHTDLATARLHVEDCIERSRAINNGIRPKTAIDTVGLGAGLYDELRAQGFPVVEAIAGAAAEDDKRFANACAEWWWHVRQLMESGELSIENNATLISQLSSRHWDWEEKRIRLESKDDMRKRGIASPDRADAAVMTYAGCCRVGRPGLRVYTPTETKLVVREYADEMASRVRNPRFWGN